MDKALLIALDPAFLEGSKVDGHNYGVPANKELPAQEVWRFNKNLLTNITLDTSITYKSWRAWSLCSKRLKKTSRTFIALAVDKNYMPYVPYDYVIEKMPMAV